MNEMKISKKNFFRKIRISSKQQNEKKRRMLLYITSDYLQIRTSQTGAAEQILDSVGRQVQNVRLNISIKKR